MPELRPSVLLRRSDRALKAGSLVVAQALFLWMFLATDPLEQLARMGAFGASSDAHDRAFAFAAAWRHGMSGNSPLYMPGFFAVAAAVWIWSEAWHRRVVRSYAISLAVAFAAACVAAPVGTAAALASFHTFSGFAPPPSVPFASRGAMFAAAYTLLTWTAFVAGSRAALLRRSWRPVAPVPPLTAGLVIVRPWTVDEFTTTWWTRCVDGDPTAIGSAVLIPLLATLLTGRLRRPRS